MSLTADMAFTIGAVIFILLDVVTGVVKGFLERNLSSSKMRTGFGHKVVYLLAITMAYVVQWLGGYGLDGVSGIPLSELSVTVICSGIIALEFLSICENACRINPDLQKLPFMKRLDENDE